MNKKIFVILLISLLMVSIAIAFSLRMAIGYSGRNNTLTYGDKGTEIFNVYNKNDYDVKITSYAEESENSLPLKYIKIKEDEFILEPNTVKKVEVEYKIKNNEKKLSEGYYITNICFMYEPIPPIGLRGVVCGNIKIVVE